MRITEAAQRLGTSPRMLRYREALGLLPPLGGSGPGSGPAARPGPAGPGRAWPAELDSARPAGRDAG